MKTMFAVVTSGVFVTLGIIKTAEMKKSLYCLEEICRFVLFTKEEIRFKSSSLDDIKEKFNKSDYSYIFWNDENITLSKYCENSTASLFNSFCSELGTTDVTGQISLCEQYEYIFNNLKESKEKTLPSRVKTYFAFCVLLSLCTLVVT